MAQIGGKASLAGTIKAMTVDAAFYKRVFLPLERTLFFIEFRPMEAQWAFGVTV